jgi:hypothetical protein
MAFTQAKELAIPKGYKKSNESCIGVLRSYGNWVYEYHAYNDGQIYFVKFKGYSDDIFSIVVAYQPDPIAYIECVNYGINGQRIIVDQNGNYVNGQFRVACNNYIGTELLLFISYTPEYWICPFCPPDSCSVDCPDSPNGVCCIPHSLTDRLLQVLQN